MNLYYSDRSKICDLVTLLSLKLFRPYSLLKIDGLRWFGLAILKLFRPYSFRKIVNLGGESGHRQYLVAWNCLLWKKWNDFWTRILRLENLLQGFDIIRNLWVILCYWQGRFYFIPSFQFGDHARLDSDCWQHFCRSDTILGEGRARSGETQPLSKQSNPASCEHRHETCSSVMIAMMKQQYILVIAPRCWMQKALWC